MSRIAADHAATQQGVDRRYSAPACTSKADSSAPASARRRTSYGSPTASIQADWSTMRRLISSMLDHQSQTASIGDDNSKR